MGKQSKKPRAQQTYTVAKITRLLRSLTHRATTGALETQQLTASVLIGSALITNLPMGLFEQAKRYIEGISGVSIAEQVARLSELLKFRLDILQRSQSSIDVLSRILKKIERGPVTRENVDLLLQVIQGLFVYFLHFSKGELDDVKPERYNDYLTCLQQGIMRITPADFKTQEITCGGHLNKIKGDDYALESVNQMFFYFSQWLGYYSNKKNMPSEDDYKVAINYSDDLLSKYSDTHAQGGNDLESEMNQQLNNIFLSLFMALFLLIAMIPLSKIFQYLFTPINEKLFLTPELSAIKKQFEGFQSGGNTGLDVNDLLAKLQAIEQRTTKNGRLHDYLPYLQLLSMILAVYIYYFNAELLTSDLAPHILNAFLPIALSWMPKTATLLTNRYYHNPKLLNYIEQVINQLTIITDTNITIELPLGNFSNWEEAFIQVSMMPHKAKEWNAFQATCDELEIPLNLLRAEKRDSICLLYVKNSNIINRWGNINATQISKFNATYQKHLTLYNAQHALYTQLNTQQRRSTNRLFEHHKVVVDGDILLIVIKKPSNLVRNQLIEIGFNNEKDSLHYVHETKLPCIELSVQLQTIKTLQDQSVDAIRDNRKPESVPHVASSQNYTSMVRQRLAKLTAPPQPEPVQAIPEIYAWEFGSDKIDSTDPRIKHVERTRNRKFPIFVIDELPDEILQNHPDILEKRYQEFMEFPYQANARKNATGIIWEANNTAKIKLLGALGDYRVVSSPALNSMGDAQAKLYRFTHIVRH